MALELMPDGVTFKKLNATQEKALKRYYKRAKDKPLIRDLALPIGLAVLGGIGAIAYIFKNEILKTYEEQEEALLTWIGGLPVAAGGGVADVLVSIGDLIFPQNPLNPEFVQLPPYAERDGTFTERPPTQFTRCQRWELDAIDVVSLVNERGPSTAFALAIARIIKNMKREGCPKPSVITQAQWDDI